MSSTLDVIHRPRAVQPPPEFVDMISKCEHCHVDSCFVAATSTDNVEYGFDPHDDSDYLHIVGNDVWGNGEHHTAVNASLRLDRQST